MRAAQYISYGDARETDATAFAEVAASALARHTDFCRAMLGNADTVDARTAAVRRRMSDAGGAIRQPEAMEAARGAARAELAEFDRTVGVSSPGDLYKSYKLKDSIQIQEVVLTAMLDFAVHADGTRGSALYGDAQGELREGLEELFRMKPESGATGAQVQEVFRADGAVQTRWRAVRPLPQDDGFFENVWRQYRENRNIY